MLKQPEHQINKNATCYQEYLNLFSSFFVVWTSGRSTFTLFPPPPTIIKCIIHMYTYWNTFTLVTIMCQSWCQRWRYMSKWRYMSAILDFPSRMSRSELFQICVKKNPGKCRDRKMHVCKTYVWKYALNVCRTLFENVTPCQLLENHRNGPLCFELCF